MFKNIYFHCVGVLLHHLYLVLMMRDVFLQYDKDYVVTPVYICSKTSYFRHVLSFEYPFDIISIFKNCSRFHEVHGGSFFSNLPQGDKTVEKRYSALSGHGSTIYDPTIDYLNQEKTKKFHECICWKCIVFYLQTFQKKHVAKLINFIEMSLEAAFEKGSIKQLLCTCFQ